MFLPLKHNTTPSFQLLATVQSSPHWNHSFSLHIFLICFIGVSSSLFPIRMKGGFRLYGLRRKKLSLISIVIMSITTLILLWEKTPSLTGLIPPYPEMLLPSDILPSWSDEDAEDLLEDGEINGVPILSSLTKTQTKKNEVEEEKTLEEVEYRTDFVIDSPQNGPLINGDANIGNNATEIEEIISSLSDEEANDLLEGGEVHGIPALSGQTKTKAKTNKENGEKTSKLEKQGTDFVMDSPGNGSLISGGEADNGNNATKNEEILSSLSDEEAKDLLEDGESHTLPTLSSKAKTEAKGNEPDDEKTLKKEQRAEFVMDSSQDRSLISLEDANNGNNATENEDILSSLSDEEAKDLLEDGEIHGSSTPSSLTNIETADGNGSTIGGKDANNWNDATENEVCNYAKGKWVPDNHRPLYSGFGCKRWLSGMWACRLTQRTDFEYENLRWQPKDCQMEEFEGSKFLRRLQNKTLAFVGDSLGRQQFQSLICMITGGEETHDVEDVGNEYGLVIPEGASRPHGSAFRFSSTNTTILYHWSSTLCDTEPIDANNPEAGYAMHLDRPAAFLREYLHKFDVLVLNTGHHWNRGKLKANRWVMHIGGVPSTDKKLAVIWRAKKITVHSVVSWVNSQLPKHPGLRVFYRTISPRHFVGGDWDTGGSCNNTKPMSVGKEILMEEPVDRTAADAVKGTRVKLLDVTALSQLRDEGHISRFRVTANPGVQDCLHWCLPGVPDTWNEILSAQI